MWLVGRLIVSPYMSLAPEWSAEARSNVRSDLRAEADGFFSTISDDELHVMSLARDALYRNAPVRLFGAITT